MLNWLKKLTGSGPVWLQSPYPAKELEWLAADFKRLDDRSPGIADRLMTYLALDEDQMVLPDIATIKDATALIKLRCDASASHDSTSAGLSKFFSQGTIRSVEFHLRLARTLNAIANTGRVSTECPGLNEDASWLAVYLMEAARVPRNIYPRKAKATLLAADELEAMLVHNGQPPSLLVRGAFWVNPAGFESVPYDWLFHVIPGMDQAIQRHPDTIRECLANPDHKRRSRVMISLMKASYPLSLCLDEVDKDATGTSKQAREIAQIWLAREPELAVPLIRRQVREGSSDQRYHAVRLLIQLEGGASHEFLRERVQEEKARPVVDEIQRLLNSAVSDSSPVEVIEAAQKLVLPALPGDLLADQKLDLRVLDELKECMVKTNQDWLSGWQKIQHQKWAPKIPNQMDASLATDWFDLLQTLSAKNLVMPEKPKNEAIWSDPFRTATKLDTFGAHPQFKLIHALRWCVILRPRMVEANYHFHNQATLPLERWLGRHGQFELRTLAAICEALGFPSNWIGECWLKAGHLNNVGISVVEPSQAWSYFAERLQMLREALGWLPVDPTRSLYRYYGDYLKANAWRVLTAFPVPPQGLVEGMWDVALGSSKTERLLAQTALQRAPGRDQRIIAALACGQMEQRAVAAEWLGRLKVAEAEAPLRQAVIKEKHDAPKAAMFTALERLGVPVEEFMDRKALQKDALKLTAKGLPPALAWFPVSQLPGVRWEDGTGTVPPEVITAWLIQACKLKTPVPGSLLRRYVATMKAADRETLGEYVLNSWLVEDVRLPTREECEAKARQMAQQYPQYYAQLSMSGQVAQHMAVLQRQPLGSANECKGILALAAACLGAGASAPAATFLKTWYGQRVHQCKALLQMLAWVEHPSAIQTLLAVGTRFRTKSIQEEAIRLAHEIAERNGWTLAELADRTIPSAGFDENGIQELDYGPRRFFLRLNADLETILEDAEQKPLKALPLPRKDDDDELAAAAKKSMSSARKVLKQVLNQQRANLYEAMCLQRCWRFEDWDVYLNRHPIVRHCCQKLVWMVSSGNGSEVVRLFRPIADGTLTDAEDNEVKLKPDEIVRLAHGVFLSADQQALWARHLEDYEVTPFFDQFNRKSPEIQGDKKECLELRDFEGWMGETFKLRSRATKLGYARGETGDGGWFNEYVKRFPTAGIQAVVEFSGNGLPEVNRQCATIALSFQPHGVGYGGVALPLSEVPNVLLTECWNDYRQMAADGTGYDPDWCNKCE